MTVRLSVAITHHPKRSDTIAKLIHQVGAPVTVVTDLTDAGLPWPPSKRSWQAIAANATHHLVLQDDVELSRHFYEAATAAIAARPDNPVTFFNYRTTLVRKARSMGHSWAVCKGGSWAQALAIPVPLIPDFLAWEREHIDPACRHVDFRLSFWMMARGLETWLTVPCLAEHVGRLDSVMGHHQPENKAALWVPEARGLTWEVPVDVQSSSVPVYRRCEHLH